MLESFHPAVRAWFGRRFPAGPTEPQAGGWQEIAAGRHTLIAAPTGSGKTLAAFLVCIDRLYRAGEAQAGPQVVYVSPLKALATDIQQNLEAPLREIAAVAGELGLAAPLIRVAVRTGDTAAAERAAMLKNPPDILITTPESLFLLVTAERSRAMLRATRTVIVDEIHSVAANKRGSHLALTLERLSHVAERPVQRVGLSATVRPISAIARLLVGAGEDRDHPDGTPRCAIVDSGHRRQLDLALEIPDDELGAVPTGEQMAQILDRIAEHVGGQRTTLVFVNTRSMAERVAHQLGERLGSELGAFVAAHHGSLSKGRRQRVEARLRAGDLRALVATASLELGIDIGPVELVCQIGSPRSIATFLQRVGRSNHTRSGTPRGLLYPTTRDELVECAALMRGVRRGRLDAIVMPDRPLDILAQQMVAESAAEQWASDELLELARRAAPFRDLSRSDFEDVTELLAEGIRTGRGRRAYYLHRDQVNGTVKGRRGARLAALTSGGAIPELGDFRVIAEPDEVQVGSVHEEWAVESRPGDVFLLGTHSWRIRRVEPGTVRVVDAHGAPPSVPFWQGEAPGRTRELSEEVSELRQAVADRSPADAGRWLSDECGIDGAAAGMIVSYLRAGLAALGALPTMNAIILERFFDEAGGMQLVGHAPFGARVNRAFGLALRKRFCVTFDFELQAAASDNAILLSLGPQHSFPLDRVPAVPGLADRGAGGAAGGAHLAAVRRALAVEPQHLADRAADAGRPEEPAGDRADGGRRPDGGGVPDAGRLPGERGAGPDRDSRPPAGPADAGGLPARGDGHRRAAGAGGRDRGGPDHGDHAGHHGALGARARDPERDAVHVPGRRDGGREPAQPAGADPPRAPGGRPRSGPAGPHGHLTGPGSRSGRSRGILTSCMTC